MRRSFSRRLGTGVGLVLVASVVAAPLTARAAVPAGASGQYGVPAVAGGPGAWTGGVSVDAAGFPAATLTSTSSSLSTASGASAFLAADTPFGQRFGSSARLPYLTADSAAGKAPSTTTLRFAAPTPGAGWGLALGDVDADRVAIGATDATGTPLTGTALAAALGWQGAFNYCVTTPKPTSCTGTGPFTDVPSWDAATATLNGSGSNTFGAAGWFAPTTALGSVTLTFSVQTGTPNYQIWVAALSVPVSGRVDGVSTATPGVAVDLLTPAGEAVRDTMGQPVRSAVEPDGRFVLPAVTDGDYRLRLDPGPDARVEGDATTAIRVDTDNGPVTTPDDTFTVAALPTGAPSSPSPSSPSSSSPDPNASSTSPTARTGARPGAEDPIAATGSDTTALTRIGLMLVIVGVLGVAAGRRRVGPGRPRRR